MRIPVLHNPNPELRIKAEEIKPADIFNSEIQELIDQMIDTMIAENGVGLAATQVGVNKRIFVAETNKGIEVFINPVITKTSPKIIDSEEGCLSVPGTFGLVKRHKRVQAEGLDRKGNPVKIKTGGLLAIIFQHEIDHLDGVLFIDKAHKIIERPSSDEHLR